TWCYLTLSVFLGQILWLIFEALLLVRLTFFFVFFFFFFVFCFLFFFFFFFFLCSTTRHNSGEFHYFFNYF
ncbi:MAG: hypothetical protein N7Q72_02395, partial [Spiroplasma sp. Tabriz.8]|nr:hypothetical protein [Spiroplasma sp. Tabriz.8]